jgi:hypothetical protein
LPGLRCQLTSSPVVKKSLPWRMDVYVFEALSVGSAAAVDEVAKKIPGKSRDFIFSFYEVKV